MRNTLLGTGVLILLACGDSAPPDGGFPDGSVGDSSLDQRVQDDDAALDSAEDANLTDGKMDSAEDGGCDDCVATESDPVTSAQMGSGTTYNVGPGQSIPEPDGVPFGELAPGDVVNIHWRAEPYRWKLCFRGQGTEAAPIVINGVTNAQGQRPVFDFDGATTASGCANVFDPTNVWSLEDYGGIVIKPGVDDPYGYQPKWLEIRNLELRGAGISRSFTGTDGTSREYVDAGAAVWIQPSTDITLENNVIYDNAFGVFTMAKDEELRFACQRVTLRSNRVYGNGLGGSYLEHNVYMQATNPVVEGNFFGIVRSGAEGSSYKSRSSGEIFRYNHVVGSARAVDLVQSEGQSDGIAQESDYGTDYVYGNVIEVDCALEHCGAFPIHYGGDNLGEQENSEALFSPSEPYRRQLYFYNNTVVFKVDREQSWRASVFDLSERDTQVSAWNNLFAFRGSSRYAWVQHAGQLRLDPANFVDGTVEPSDERALPLNFEVAGTDLLHSGSAMFVGEAQNNYRLSASSSARTKATMEPPNLDPAYADIPVKFEPLPGRVNGLKPRITASDLGAFEHTP